MSSSMAPSSSTDPMFQQMNQPNLPTAPEAPCYTYHHQNPPAVPFQPQNHQQPLWDQDHPSDQPQDFQWNQENWPHHNFMNHHQPSSSNFHMPLNHQFMNHQFPQQPHRVPNHQERNYMNHQMFHQPAPNHNFMNPQLAPTAPKDQPGPSFISQQMLHAPDAANNHYMSQQLALSDQPGSSFSRGSFGFLNDKFAQMNMAPRNVELKPDFMKHQDQQGPSSDNYTHHQKKHDFMMYPQPGYLQGMDQMPPQLAHALPQYGFPGQNPIVFNLLNAASWKLLNSLTNEMMVTNDGRAIFPRFEIGIMGLIPKASYNVGVKLQLVNPKKYTYDTNQKTWKAVDRRKSEEVAEQETNEVLSKVQTGHEIMENGLQLKMVNIYTIGNEKKKKKSPKSEPISEERARWIEQKERNKKRTMIRVFSQQKYIPIFTLYQQMDFGTPQPIATTQFPETEFITTTGFRNQNVKQYKKVHNEYVRGDYRDM